MRMQSVRELLLKKTESTSLQFIRYIFVGGLAAAVDTACLYVLFHHFGINPLISAAAGFILGLLVNYAISVVWIFKSTGNFKAEFALFAVIGLGGLGWTELILWIGVEQAGLPVLLAKAIALALVLLWNFWMRKKLVFARSTTDSAAA